MKHSSIYTWITGAVLFFLYLPIVILILYSFNDSRFGGEWSGFTLKWYEKLWYESDLWQAVGNSLVIAISTTFVSTILGKKLQEYLYLGTARGVIPGKTTPSSGISSESLLYASADNHIT